MRNEPWRGGGPRVVELGSGIPAAYAARLLGDFGADVIKVEPPGIGDSTRALGPFPARSAERGTRNDGPVPSSAFRAPRSALGMGGLFLYLNAGKRSVTLDLASTDDVE